MKDMDKQMGALDDFVAKARSHNGRFHEAHLGSLNTMAGDVRRSYSSVHDQLEGLGTRLDGLQANTSEDKNSLLQSTVPLEDEVRKPLSALRANVQARPLEEYVPTGATPLKRRYEYPSTLPQTESHEAIVSRLRNSKQLSALPFGGENNITPLNSSSPTASPSKGFVYNDAAEDEVGPEPPAPSTTPSNTGLREVDANVVARPTASSTPVEEAPVSSARMSSEPVKPSSDTEDVPESKDTYEPPSKRHCSTAAVAESKLPQKALNRKMAGMMEGPENVPPSGGRRLRGRPST